MTYMLDSDWLKKFLLRSDWLPTDVALFTTYKKLLFTTYIFVKILLFLQL